MSGPAIAASSRYCEWKEPGWPRQREKIFASRSAGRASWNGRSGLSENRVGRGDDQRDGCPLPGPRRSVFQQCWPQLFGGQGSAGGVAAAGRADPDRRVHCCAGVCTDCMKLRRLRDQRTRTLQTLFGTVRVAAPRVRLCSCLDTLGTEHSATTLLLNSSVCRRRLGSSRSRRAASRPRA